MAALNAQTRAAASRAGRDLDLRAMSRLSRLPWRILRALLLGLAAIVLAIEDWGWRPLSDWLGRITRWPPLARLEARVREVPPPVALALFLVPALALFPIKLVALWLIHLGRSWLGVVVILAAKLLGTALVGRLFVLTEPQLMHYAWFARALEWWRATKRHVRELVGRSRVWQALRRTVGGLRARIGRVLRRAR